MTPSVFYFSNSTFKTIIPIVGIPILYQMYVRNNFYVTFVYIFKLSSNFIDIITTVVFHYALLTKLQNVSYNITHTYTPTISTYYVHT